MLEYAHDRCDLERLPPAREPGGVRETERGRNLRKDRLDHRRPFWRRLESCQALCLSRQRSRARCATRRQAAPAPARARGGAWHLGRRLPPGSRPSRRSRRDPGSTRGEPNPGRRTREQRRIQHRRRVPHTLDRRPPGSRARLEYERARADPRRPARHAAERVWPAFSLGRAATTRVPCVSADPAGTPARCRALRE